MRKKTKRTILIFSAAFLIVLGVYTAMDLFSRSDAKAYEANWHISIPCDLKKQYGAQSEDNLFGDGYRYTVYSCPEGEFLPFFNGAWYSESNLFLSHMRIFYLI